MKKKWKKVRNIKQDRWESENDQVFVGKLKTGWRVGSIYKGWEKKFKTKTKALIYARNYMRKH